MSEAKFWNAVRENHVELIASMLRATPELAKARTRGEAWNPGHRYTPAGQQRVPPDFPFTNTALHTAAVTGRTELAALLLQYNADPNALGYEPNKGLSPPVVLAAWEGQLDTLRVLLEAGANPNCQASAESALYTAAEHGDLDKVALLLQYGAQQDIFTAAILGDVELVARMLKAYPALAKARSHKRNRTPLEEAREHQRGQVVTLLESQVG